MANQFQNANGLLIDAFHCPGPSPMWVFTPWAVSILTVLLEPGFLPSLKLWNVLGPPQSLHLPSRLESGGKTQPLLNCPNPDRMPLIISDAD